MLLHSTASFQTVVDVHYHGKHGRRSFTFMPRINARIVQVISGLHLLIQASSLEPLSKVPTLLETDR